MERSELESLFMDANEILETMSDWHYGPTEDDAKIAATAAALVIKHIKEDK